MKRVNFSNATIDTMISGTTWTRDIPMGMLRRSMPGVTPAHDSMMGRGAPVFDLFNEADYRLLSVKVSKESCRNPPNVVLTTGSKDHLKAIYQAIRAGNLGSLPVSCFNHSKGVWYAIHFDAVPILRRHPPVKATGKRGVPVTVSSTPRACGKDEFGNKAYRTYYPLRINFKPNGLVWERVDFPALPEMALIGG